MSRRKRRSVRRPNPVGQSVDLFDELERTMTGTCGFSSCPMPVQWLHPIWSEPAGEARVTVYAVCGPHSDEVHRYLGCPPACSSASPVPFAGGPDLAYAIATASLLDGLVVALPLKGDWDQVGVFRPARRSA